MDKIRIQGYESFKNLELTLKRINILIGANGSGKSNFLSFFELLNQLYNQNLQLYYTSLVKPLPSPLPCQGRGKEIKSHAERYT